jgi:osmoprotectant transport system permease protein
MSTDFMAHVATHLGLSASGIALAIAIGVPLATLGADRPALRSVLLACAGGFRVIPSLAILALAIPLLGLGFAPAVLALVVLALPPIVINTDLALRSVPAPTLEAARATGMTPRQVARRIRWPLALPVVSVGVRIATVEVIASASLAAFIGGGGLGDYIVGGLQTGDYGELVVGALTVAALAIVADASLGVAQRRLAA